MTDPLVVSVEMPVAAARNGMASVDIYFTTMTEADDWLRANHQIEVPAHGIAVSILEANVYTSLRRPMGDPKNTRLTYDNPVDVTVRGPFTRIQP